MNSHGNWIKLGLDYTRQQVTQQQHLLLSLQEEIRFLPVSQHSGEEGGDAGQVSHELLLQDPTRGEVDLAEGSLSVGPL